jgi:hypothetical protein
VNKASMTQTTARPVEDVLLEELAQGDAVLGTLGPILRHLLANDDHTLFSDEIVARVRGMVGSIARQLLIAQAEAAALEDAAGFIGERQGGLIDSFLENPALLGHAHALAIEWQLTERFQARNYVDPVLSPLLQALIASADGGIASAAMVVLAAQARFVQTQRRMELPLGELPGDLFHAALITMRAQAGDGDDQFAAIADERLRGAFDESRGRIGMMARLVTRIGGQAIEALAVDHAGVAIFLTALAIGSGQDRDLAVLSTNDRQPARLALSLRASGLKPKAVEEQFLYLHPDLELPEGFDQLRPDRAAALLHTSSSQGGE